MNTQPPSQSVEVEVLPPEPGTGRSGSGWRAAGDGQTEAVDSGAAFHPLAVGLMMLVDLLWTVPELAVVDWFVTVPMSFLMVTALSALIHRVMRRDSWSVAILKSLFLGIVAAVPTSVTSTPVGLALLAWAGIRKLK